MEPNDIVTAIMNGSCDQSLDVLRAALRQREKTIGDITLLTIKPGARVRLKNLTPKYLNGMLGTVKGGAKPNSKRIPVELDESVPRFGKRVTPPASCLEVLR